MDFFEYKKQREEEVRLVLEDWPLSKLLIGYKYENARGVTLCNIDHEIDKALKEEMKRE